MRPPFVPRELLKAKYIAAANAKYKHSSELIPPNEEKYLQDTRFFSLDFTKMPTYEAQNIINSLTCKQQTQEYTDESMYNPATPVTCGSSNMSFGSLEKDSIIIQNLN